MRPRLHPAAAAIVRSLRALDGGPLVIEQADSISWASLTLDGALHWFTLRFHDPATAARIAERLPEHEFDFIIDVVIEIGEVAVEGAVLRFAALTVEA